MIVGLGHKARQGKDTAGSYLEKHFNFKVVHFADELKHEAEMWSWSPQNKNESAISVLSRHKETIHKNESRYVPEYNTSIFDSFFNLAEENCNMSFLQWLGSFRRQHNKNYWVDILIKSIPHSIDSNYAICDMRYINELKAIKSVAGIVIDVQCFENGKRYIDPERDRFHVSETELDGIPHDFTIVAEKGDIKSLEIQVSNIMKYMGV